MKSAFVCATVIVAGLLCASARADDDQLQKDLDALKGEWKVVWKIDANGKKTRPGDSEIQSVTFFPKKGRFSWPELKTEGKFMIDPSQDPPTLVFSYMDPTFGKTTSPFIYKFEDDKLVLGWQILIHSTSWDDKRLEKIILKRKD